MDKEPDREQPGEGCCPNCGDELADEERRQPVCRRCDERLGRELVAYLSFVAAIRE